MNLKVAASDGRQHHAAFETSQVVGQSDALVVSKLEAGGVVGVHQDSVAGRAIDGIRRGIDNRVELFSSTRCQAEGLAAPGGSFAAAGQEGGAEMGFSIGGRG